MDTKEGLQNLGAAFVTGFFAFATFWEARLLVQEEDAPLTLRASAVLLGLSTFLALRLLLLRLVHKRESHAYGSAGFALTESMADLFVASPAALKPGSVLLGSLNSNLLALSPLLARQHGVIVGGSGTGKSWSFFLPNAAYCRGISTVVTDPKSEIWQYTSGFHDSVRFAPTDPDRSACFNWIPLCRDARMAELCARAIVEAGATEKQEPPWPDLEAAFLSSLFSHASTLATPTPLSAYELFTRQEPAALMESFLSSASPVAREQAIIFQQTHERMRGSIVPVVAAKLQFLRDPVVSRFTSAELTPPDFGKLRCTPQSVYWCVREQDIARLRPLSALFFTLLLEQLAATPMENGVNAIPVHMLLDEFANLGVIPNFDTTISLARGRGVSLWLGIQSLSQIEARYGRANAQTILTNCATKIALSGLDVETAEYFSRSLGQATEQTPRRSWQRKRFSLFASGVTDTVQDHARPLLTSDEVRRIGGGEALAIIGNRRPILLEKTKYKLAAKAAKTKRLGPALSAPCAATAAAAVPSKSKKAAQKLKEDLPPPLPEELTAALPVKQAGQRFSKTQKGSHRQTTWLPKPAAETK
ncbi:MAG: type IV secretory system conjugative DNA transfer family protein [Armatimonadota bacterium]